MTDLNKIKLARVFSSSLFWLATIISYYKWRGVPLSEVFRIISVYSFCIVLFEYPTGVIGDYFSHKVSVALGYFICFLASLLGGMAWNSGVYYLLLALLAFGASLVSGSDIALLHAASSDFKKDASNLKIISLIWTMFAVSIGGFLGKYNLALPIYLTAISYLIAFAIILFVNVKSHERGEGNVFSKAIEGVKFLKGRVALINLLALNTLISAVFISMKWIYNPFFEVLKVDTALWGILISATTLCVVAGVWLYKKTKAKNIVIPFIFMIVAFVITGFTSFKMLPLLALLIVHFLGAGYIETFLEVRINDYLTNSIRASILSLTSLLIRSFSSIYILAIGLVLANSGIPSLFYYTSFGVGIIGTLLLIRVGKQDKLLMPNV